MPEIEVIGRELLHVVIRELSSYEARNEKSYTTGIITGLLLSGKNLPFESSGLVHLILAETIIVTFYKLLGQSEALVNCQASIDKIKKELGVVQAGKMN